MHLALTWTAAESSSLFPLLVFVVVLLYFVPAVFAWVRSHPQRGAITALNVAAGWTGLFWVVALVWAFYRVRDLPRVQGPTRTYP